MTATAVWWQCLMHVPPHAISQLLTQVPVWLVLSLPAWLMLRGLHRAHKAAGGTFRSAWRAVGIAILVKIAVTALLLSVAAAVASISA